jgi:anti-sigma-K factor RskA
MEDGGTVSESISHDEIRDLLPIHALDALPEDEASQVEAHLKVCESCVRTLDELRSTATAMHSDYEDPPASTWGHISSEITRGDVAPTKLPKVAAIDTPARSRRGSLAMAISTGTLLVAASVAAVMGIQVYRLDAKISQLSKSVTAANIKAIVTSAELQPGAKQVNLLSGTGTTAATAILLPNGQGVLKAVKMKPLPSNKTYQLWAVTDSQAISLGLLGSKPTVSIFRAGSNKHFDLAITVEPSGGTARPTSSPLAAGIVI